MPLKFLIDSDARHANRRSRVLPVEEALETARRERYGLYSYELMRLMVDAQQDRGDKISTTTILSECDRNLVLERMTDYAASLDDLFASFRGTMFHGQLERAAADTAIVEKRYHALLPGGELLTCKPDLLDVEAGVLWDYKIVAKLPRYAYPYHHHADQLKINRWIIDHAHAIEWEDDRPEPIAEVEERIGAAVRPHEWRELVVYYIHPLDGPRPLVVTQARPDGKRGRVPDMGDDADIERLMSTRYAVVREAFDAYKRDGTIPDIPEGWDALSGWLCVPYCNVRQTCLRMQARD
jgi:hypothetical protein